MTKYITTGDLRAALLKAYPLPEYATFFEVGDGTGHLQSRWADAVAMACWPSRGLAVIGFELKADRGDWLREKKNPKKSAAIQKYCDHWILMTAPGVVEPGELPATWGHIELHGRRVQRIVEAPKLNPEPLSRTFIAALLRRAGEHSRDLLQAATRQAIEDAQARVEEQVKSEVERRTRRNSAAIEAIEAFKAKTGIDLMERGGGQYAGEHIGEDFMLFRQVREKLRFQGFEHTEQALRKAADALKEAQVVLLDNALVDPPKEKAA